MRACRAVCPPPAEMGGGSNDIDSRVIAHMVYAQRLFLLLIMGELVVDFKRKINISFVLKFFFSKTEDTTFSVLIKINQKII